MDHFVASVKEPPKKIEASLSTTIRATKKISELKKTLTPVIEGLEDHVAESSRVKSFATSSDKVQKELGNRKKTFLELIGEYINPLSNSKNVGKNAEELEKIKNRSFLDAFAERNNLKKILSNKKLTKELIGDQFGARYIIKDENFISKNGQILNSYEEITKRLCNLHNEGKIKLLRIENYHGRDIKGYATEAIKETFAESGVLITTKEKSAGYTRMNIDAEIDGVLTEIQVGGKYTTPFGECEHLLYDMRENKTLNFSKYTNEQREIAKQIKASVKKVYKNKASKDAYEDYLNSVWAYLRNAELNGTKCKMSEAPKIPSGLPEILDAQNLLKLSH